MYSNVAVKFVVGIFIIIIYHYYIYISKAADFACLDVPTVALLILEIGSVTGTIQTRL